MGIFEGVSPVLLVLWLASLALVAITTWMAGFGHIVGGHYLRHRRRGRGRKPTVDEQIAAVGQLVGAEQYGRPLPADPSPTIPITGRDPKMPPRLGLVLPETRELLLQDEPIRPTHPPRPEDLAQLTAVERQADEPTVERRDDDEPGNPPSGGGRSLTATAIQPRYDWAHLNGRALPEAGPWRERAKPLFDAVARFRRQRPDVRLLWSVLAALPPLRRWLAQRLASGVHHARHAARRGAESWEDTRAVLSARWYRERQEASKATQELILHAHEAKRRTLPWVGCVPR